MISKETEVHSAMKDTTAQRLTREYLAAVDSALAALDRAKKLRAALRRKLAKTEPKEEPREPANHR